MSIDPFEKKLQEQPWRQPSPELRDRLFPREDAAEPTVVRGPWIAQKWVAWAALLLVSVSMLAYTLWPSADSPAAVATVGLEPVEIASTQDFFDLSTSSNETWSGPLTLTIESN